jgi:Uma2 family endonuclease
VKYPTSRRYGSASNWAFRLSREPPGAHDYVNLCEPYYPGSPDVALLVEVGDSSLSQDQGIKKRLYARSGFPIYWIVNLADRRIEVYTEPATAKRPDYCQRRDYGPDDAVPVVLDGAEVGTLTARDLLP